MQNFRRDFILLLAVLFFIIPKNAHAYLDPGAGSYILQIVGATLFVGLFAIKNFWKQIRNFFSNLFSKKDEKENTKDSKTKN